MNPHHRSKEEDLRRREEALKEREIQIRMRELEAELDPTPVYPTAKHEATPDKKKRPWYKRLLEIGKFCLIVVAVVVAVRLTAWLATAILILGIAWVAYKIFLEGDRN